jgi:hypothetical protein
VGPARAANRSQVFPPAHELFRPLQADPTEAFFAVQYGAPVSQRAIATVNVGDYLGIYRWALPREEDAIQLNIGGKIFSRFDATPEHNLQVIDYYGNVPIDVRLGRVSMRFMFYHDSSHLGDDTLRVKNIQSENHSWEALRSLISIQPFRPLRLYAGYTDAFHTKPGWDGPQAYQTGAEIYFAPIGENWHPYWANDIQAWHRSGYDPTWTSQLGFKLVGDTSSGRGISYFVQFMRGPRLEGQTFNTHETVWSVGMKFDLSQHPAAPNTPPDPGRGAPSEK